MVQPDLRCQRCGFVFRNLIEIKGGTLVLDGTTFGCPNCGAVSDGGGTGVYVVANGVLERIASVVPSEQELDALLRVLRSSAATQGPAALKVAAEVEVPRLVPMLEIAGLPPKQWALFIVALIAAVVQLRALVDKPNWTEALKAAAAAITTALATRKPKDASHDAVYKGTMAALEERDRKRRERIKVRRAQKETRRERRKGR
jgi:hypothetical protein